MSDSAADVSSPRTARVCPDCGHYERFHTTGGNCHGGPPLLDIPCNCVRMRPIEMEPPTQQLAERIAALEAAAPDHSPAPEVVEALREAIELMKDWRSAYLRLARGDSHASVSEVTFRITPTTNDLLSRLDAHQGPLAALPAQREPTPERLIEALLWNQSRWELMGGPWAGPAIYHIDEVLAAYRAAEREEQPDA